MTTDSHGERPHTGDWRSLLAGAPPVIDLATDRPRQAVQRYRPGRVDFTLRRQGLNALAAHATAAGCDRNAAVLAAFVAVLHRHTGQDDLILGVAQGDDVEPLPWRCDLSGLPDFPELMRRVGQAGHDARRCAALGVAELTRQLLPVPGTRHHPLFQVAFVGGAAPREPAAPAGAVPLDLLCLLADGDHRGTLVYNAELFDEETVSRFASRFDTWLMGLGSAAMPVAAIDLIPAEERRLLVSTWNDTAAEFPSRCLHELFEDRVRIQPDAPAVIVTGGQFSYTEVNQRANRLAHYLRRLGVRPNDPVGLAVERSLDMVVGLVGIAKAGGAYVPLDPNYPHERLMLMQQESTAAILLTQGRLADRFSSGQARVVCLDDEWDVIAGESADTPEAAVTPSNLAYVIFTSGSTGRPKCIALDHRGRVNNFHDFNQRYAIGPGDRLLALSSLSFDMTAYDVFGTLMAGGAIVLPTAAEERDPAQWARMIGDCEVTVWHSVPALLAMLVDHAEHRPDFALRPLRLVLLGGDWIPLDLPDRIKALAPGVHTVSMGGATECSMDSTIYDIEKIGPEWKSIPYGVPMRNQLAFVLDSFGHLVPAGVPGELYLGGVGVAWGYLGRPDLTAARFVPHPYGAPGERLYRTGDLVRYFPDGNLELLGRIDNQVKIRSHRIELGEIVATLNRHPAVADAVVIVRGERAEDKRLIAYIVPKLDAAGMSHQDDPKRALPLTLRHYLAERLPEYMVPPSFVLLDRLPLTPNGKIDRRALPDPDQTRPVLGVAFVAPRNAVEEVLAGIWAEVLGFDEVGVLDNFFELGGHSLTATQIVSRVIDALGVPATLRSLFEHPTVASLGGELEQLARDAGVDWSQMDRLLREVSGLSDSEVDTLLAQKAPQE